MSTASEVKHTPGPWTADHSGAGWEIRPERSIHALAILPHESESTARLIAAAPAMLEALEKLCAIRPQSACDENPDHYPESCRWCKAKNVIRLAKGETV